ncbi:MAG: metallophosphoesterase [Lachnospiraceae bacterium]|nr:metallophosphoesterase [Lachnospiraceae bacterium]
MKEYKKLCLLLAGDVHGSRDHLKRLIHNLNNDNNLEAMVFLGDMAGYKGFYDTDSMFYTECLKESHKPVLTVIGNHDTGNNDRVKETCKNEKELFYKWIEPNLSFMGDNVAIGVEKTYYYKDFDDSGIRLIVLNQYEHSEILKDGDTYKCRRNHEMFSQNQIDWYIRTLLQTPDDYGVMVCLHNSPGWMMPLNMGYKWDFFGGFGIRSFIKGNIIADITEAFIRGKKINRKYKVMSDSGSKRGKPMGMLEAVADFGKRKGEFIGYFGGHYHNCLLSNPVDYPGQILVTVDCAGIDDVTLKYSEFIRDKVKGTNYDSYATVTVDRNEKTVTFNKKGSCETEYGLTRKQLIYTY